MKRSLLMLALLGALSGCSMLSPSVNAAQEAAATAVVESAERVLCRDIPVGTWMRLYGSSAERMRAWQALCIPPVTSPAK